MARPKGEIKVVCQNLECQYYQKRRGKDIIKSGKYQTGHQRYYCHHCKTYFMETKGTPFYRKSLSENEIINICKHLLEKKRIRSIERITGHHRDTIGRLLEDMAEHAEQMNEYFKQKLNLVQSECDELWKVVKQNRKKLSQVAQNGLNKVLRESSIRKKRDAVVRKNGRSHKVIQ